MIIDRFSTLAFIGAIAIFIYGIRLARSGVQLLAGDRLRGIIASLTDNRFMALGIGAITTLILQSSNATTITLVSFAATGTMTLAQAMGVILGADIGTTVVVILLAIEKIATYSLLLLIFGILVDLVTSGKRWHYISMMLMGFGFIFFGMKLMVLITQPLQGNPLLQQLFATMATHPLAALLITALFTVFVQNSAAPIGLAIALAFSGLIGLPAAIPIVLGANVGTCSGSLLASLKSNTAGKQVAFAHLLLKIAGASLTLLFLQPFITSVTWIAKLAPIDITTSGQIPLAHLLFNLYLSIIFLPLIRPGTWIIRKLIPEPREAEATAFGSRFLDTKALEVPSLAFANVRRELQRMLDLAMEMFRDTITVIDRNDRVLMEAIQEQDDQIDILDRDIKFYLAKLSQETLTADQAAAEMRLVAMTSKIEEIGDVIKRNLIELAEKKIRKARRFSDQGWQDITEMHSQVLSNFKITVASLATEDETLARRLLRHHAQLEQLEVDYHQGHIDRLHRGLKESFETSSIHLDLLSNIFRIDALLVNVIQLAYPNL